MVRPPPRVFTIPAGTHFTDALAHGILKRYGDDSLALERVLILLPTRRACRSLLASFLRARGGQPLLLPSIRPIADVDEEEISLYGGGLRHGSSERTLGIPPAIPAMRRQLLLSRLILELDARRRARASDGMDHGQAVALASELADLLDQMQTERLPFSVLEKVVPDQLAAHWQQTLDFLKILTEHWPRLLQAEGCIDPADRRNRLLEMQTDIWRDTPPDHPVIAAGSTGTIPATADLLKVIASLPNGMVILPGLDQFMDEETWRAVDDTHHQYGLRRLLNHLGVPRFDVPVWEGADREDRLNDHAEFLSEAMRPAETTHAWRGGKHFVPSVLTGLSRVDCPGPGEEARVVALVMRKVLETPGRTAALVTPDRALARRVAAEVRRWDVEIDDSAGQPLGQTPPGTFFRLVAQMAAERLAPVPLLAALKHPLAAGGRGTRRNSAGPCVRLSSPSCADRARRRISRDWLAPPRCPAQAMCYSRSSPIWVRAVRRFWRLRARSPFPSSSCWSITLRPVRLWPPMRGAKVRSECGARTPERSSPASSANFIRQRRVWRLFRVPNTSIF